MTDEQAAEIAGKDTAPPDNINELGIRWWLDRRTRVPESIKARVKCWVVVMPNGTATRLVTSNNSIVYESTLLEGIGCWLDICAKFPDILDGEPKQ